MVDPVAIFQAIIIVTGVGVWLLIGIGCTVGLIFGAIPAMFRWISYHSWQAWYDVSEKRQKAVPIPPQGGES